MVKTTRLYYNDAYLRRFQARVVERRSVDGGVAVALDQTAFYPTGGGQPADTGTLGGTPVFDVVAEDGVIWHHLATGSTDDLVAGQIDWDRRFDHMQQHTGQHVLTAAVVQVIGANTVGFHLGSDASTIDLDRVGVDADALHAAESTANGIVDAALPVTVHSLSEDQAMDLPLRKAPSVAGQIRVVQVAGFDWSACGGTHVSNTSQIGAIKITGIERRTDITRMEFLCGRRARDNHDRLHRMAANLARNLSTGQEQLVESIDRLLAEVQSLRTGLRAMEDQWCEATARALWATAQTYGEWRLVTATEPDLERARKLAQALRAKPGMVALLAVSGERPQLVFVRADDVQLDMAMLLREAVKAYGGRGGGRPEWAQGGVPTNGALSEALADAHLALIAGVSQSEV